MMRRIIVLVSLAAVGISGCSTCPQTDDFTRRADQITPSPPLSMESALHPENLGTHVGSRDYLELRLEAFLVERVTPEQSLAFLLQLIVEITVMLLQ